MKFRDLPIGATFRVFARGSLLMKTSATTYATETVRNQTAGPDVFVMPEDLTLEDQALEVPYGETNEVEFSKKAVRLDGVFTAEQLEAVLAELMLRPRKK